MIKGISKSAFVYVAKAERGLPPEEQTKFWIRPAIGDRMAEAGEIYERNRKRDERGQVVYDKHLEHRAALETFLHVVERIEIFLFPEGSKFYEDGKVWPLIDSPEMLIAVANCLEQDVLNELVAASLKPSAAMTRDEEKKVADNDVARFLEGSE